MKERIYLDYNATSLINPEVAELMVGMLQEPHAYNPSSIHEDGRKARGIMEKSRQEIAKELHIDTHKDDIQIIFTSSGTEANNLVSHNFKHLKFLIGATEHVSIFDLQHPDKIIIEVTEQGLIDPNYFTKLLKLYPGPKLVSIMLANNETGIIQDIQTLSKIAHQENAIVHCDASQAFCRIKVNFHDLECDMMTISSHKCGGPVGVAALISKKSMNINSMIKGGKQELGLRAGTENIIAIAGFGLIAHSYSNQFEKVSLLRDYLEKEIIRIAPDSKIIGHNTARLPNTSSIRMPNVKSEEQLIKFDLAGISISAGSACSSGRIADSHVLKAMNIDETIINEIIRVSIGPRTTKDQLDKFIQVWTEIYKKAN